MFFEQHLYFLISLYVFLVLWLPLFILNRKNRKSILYMSFLGLILGFPFAQKMYLADWWHPNFIFNFPVKIEDLIFGFCLVGSISSIYSFLKSSDQKLSGEKFEFISKIFICIITFAIFFSLFYMFKLHSFWASIIGSTIGVIMVTIKKPGFLKYAFFTGIFLSIIILPGYLVAIYLDPEFIQNEWFLHKLSGISFLSIPIEEFIWYIFAALGMSALQELFE